MLGSVPFVKILILAHFTTVSYFQKHSGAASQQQGSKRAVILHAVEYLSAEFLYRILLNLALQLPR